MLARAADTHVFWITSRAAGFVALLLASLSVGVGLTMSLRLLRGRTIDLRITHEALSLAALAALVLHAVSLLGDAYLHPSLADVAIPFASSFGEPWLGIGIVAGWMTLLLGLSYYVRRQIGTRRWRKLHRFTALAWALGLVHALGEGTDAGTTWFLALLGIVVVPSAVLLALRLFGERETRPEPVVRAAADGTRAPAPRAAPSASAPPRLWSSGA